MAVLKGQKISALLPWAGPIALGIRQRISLWWLTAYRSTGLALVLLAVLSACVQNPLAPYQSQAELVFQTQRGATFNHQVVFKPAGQSASDVLHIYIEGDGRPWWRPTQVALDPTPKRPLMLALMTSDKAPALYIGRPCYFQLADANCNPRWWTDKRYAAEVVESINAVINHYAGDYSSLVLMGHSGGGTLAALIASVRSDVSGLITLAANLDINAWADHHAYTRLAASLNPADIQNLDASIQQYHYVGSEDTQVPQALIAPVVKQWGQQLNIVDGYNHSCCWQQLWPSVLGELATQSSGPSSTR